MVDEKRQLETIADFPLQLLKAFVLAAQEPSLELAAERLGVTQPALSMQLQKLEERMGLVLFQGKSRKKSLTGDGHKLLDAVQGHLAQLDLSLRDFFHDVVGGEPSRFRFGMRRELFEPVCQKLDFSQPVELVDGGSQELMDHLEKGILDAAIVSLKPQQPTLVVRKLFVSGVHIAVHTKFLSRARDQTFWDPEFIKRTPFLAYKSDPPFVAPWLKKIGLSPQDLRTVCICDDWNALARLVESGAGFSVLPSNIGLRLDNVATMAFSQDLAQITPFYLVYRSALKDSSRFQNLIKGLKSG
jgi:DNA-binding transcriptional LysR family regulator